MSLRPHGRTVDCDAQAFLPTNVRLESLTYGRVTARRTRLVAGDLLRT